MVASLNLALLVFSLPLSATAAALGRTDGPVPGKKLLSHFGSQGINLWKLQREKARVLSSGDDTQHILGATGKVPDAQYFTQPLDHFDKSVNKTFGQRFWVNADYYEPGGPVFVLDGGETSGEDRLPYLKTGILAILANATKGLGIVLEHRYYGGSIPVEDFSTDSMRWLNNAQALEDSANFIANVKIDGLNYDVTAPKTKWIYYGGSYAGARAAHMRVLYPELVFGAIASSAVTHATIDYWEYNDAVRRTADPVCVAHLMTAVQVVDDVLATRVLAGPLKSWFGLGGLESNQDFASLLMTPIGYVQGQNWDPEVSSDDWRRFCAVLGSGGAERTIGVVRVPAVVSNLARWVREEIVSQCPSSQTVEECFGTNDDSKFQSTDLGQEWRAWMFQVCTEWGYFQGAPPNPSYPSIVSRLLTLEYTSAICRQAFPPGLHFSVPAWPNVTVVNELGDYGLAADRLAFIDGDEDPWLPATPHSPHGAARDDTELRPFKLIRTGVHHHDENGLARHTLEPAHIQEIHRQEVGFVRAWLGGTVEQA